ncbi:MAG: HNH endonuclease, partial [Bacteroidales bacterium]|nr:HNH endonuclease [Bacteroidales bacterium]
MSKSVEHIVPESFGNGVAILRKGIVCDKCNNYFARKVEQPFLESEVVRLLRQELEIKNKKGKVITDYPYPRVGTEYVKQISNNNYLIYTKAEKSQCDLASDVAEYQKYLEYTDSILLKEDRYVSRLLAKMAIEYFILRCGSSDEVCDYVQSDEIFIPIRTYARYGSQQIWKYNVRRIYARDEAYNGDPF